MSDATYRILLIDDEEPLLRFLTRLLEKQGYHVDTAINGKEGIQKTVSNTHDLVITDFKMPGLSGEQVLKKIKERTGGNMPVIGMSGTPWLLDTDLFDAVLAKPIARKKLLSLIEKFIPPEKN